MTRQLEQELRGAMERFTDDVRIPPGLAGQAYRHQHKRRVTARAITAAGTVTVLTAGGLAAAGAAGAFGAASGHPVPTAYTAYVISHVEHALAAPRVGNLVEADRTTFSPGSTLQPFPDGLVGSAGGAGPGSPWSASYTLRWIHHGTIRVSAVTTSGQRVFSWGSSPAHGTTAVIYRDRTWWTAPGPGGTPGRSGPGSTRCLRGGEIDLSGDAGNGWPAFIRSQLACGAYTVAGRQVIDGISTIKIAGAGGHFTFWVNPVNYLPVRADLAQRQTDFHWLAATRASLAHLKVTVPAGFRQVPAPAPLSGQAP
jgi:hypothetical protein